MPKTRRLFSVRFGRNYIDFTSKPYIMGILNVTPDSFSDGACFAEPSLACERALMMAQEGADFIDIGGESTRPGAEGVSGKEEMKRVVPVIRKLRKQTKIKISVDTTKADVAQAALEEGADFINDTSALRRDRRMGPLLARWKVPIVLMHMRGRNSREMQKKCVYRDVIREITRFFKQSIVRAESDGILNEQIILDPGIGFGKLARHNLTILSGLEDFLCLGRPLLVGASRKSLIGHVCGAKNPEERLPGSLAAAVLAVLNGAHMVRVHDVAETRQALQMMKAIQAYSSS